jgi:hypothetical protein
VACEHCFGRAASGNWIVSDSSARRKTKGDFRSRCLRLRGCASRIAVIDVPLEVASVGEPDRHLRPPPPLCLAVDLVWNRSSVPPQYDEAGAELPKPVLHFGMTLEDRQAAREFLIDRGPSVVVYRLAPRYEGILMVGLADDGQASASPGKSWEEKCRRVYSDRLADFVSKWPG